MRSGGSKVSVSFTISSKIPEIQVIIKFYTAQSKGIFLFLHSFQIMLVREDQSHTLSDLQVIMK